jgi:excisionase family DNA binding protein
MAAYATAERAAQTTQLRVVSSATGLDQRLTQPAAGAAGFDVVLAHLADLVAERLAVRLAAPPPEVAEWLDTRDAADYLGVHRDTVRRLAAERTIPSEQEGPGCKLFFRRSDLDAWRCSDRRHVRILARGRS